MRIVTERSIPEVMVRRLRKVSRVGGMYGGVEYSYLSGVVKDVVWKYSIDDFISLDRLVDTRIDYEVVYWSDLWFPGNLIGLVYFSEDSVFTSLDMYILSPILDFQLRGRSRVSICLINGLKENKRFFLVVVRGSIHDLYKDSPPFSLEIKDL